MGRALKINFIAYGLILLGAAFFGLAEVKDAKPGVSPSLQPTAPLHYTNRLIQSKSPYLIQHAHNSVDWYPWGEEAFAKAREESKPIFLSVGYSTCHWCHVMEHESFENPQLAAMLSEHFVCIKVDREERPDVDAVYMTFVRATTGGGGWPMSVWLTPDLKPFYGGTYFPPDKFTKLLETIATTWKADSDKIKTSSEAVARQLKQLTDATDTTEIPQARPLLEKTYDQLKSNYEPVYGGVGSAPKFPRPVALNFMLRYYSSTGTKEALDMSLFTLKKMTEGGTHDHVGGGFHRYSTDTRWHVPHFEKMLYDQAQLVCSYLEAYQITHDRFYADVARDILAYVQRDMTGDEGQFYSAEDADSATSGNPSIHAEGAFYVWEDAEISQSLDKETAGMFKYHYGVKEGGNVENDPRGEFPKKNVLIASHSIEETAKKFAKSREDTETLLAKARQALFTLRAKRPRPHLDDKTLTAWNGLMISAFSRAYQVLDDPAYLAAATKSARFMRSKLYSSKTATLTRRYRAGETAIEGFADDYAFLIQGLLDLYETSFDINDLIWAYDLQKKQNELFWDPGHGGGFFSTAGQDPNILLRMKEDYDGAEPSPNSVAALNLLRLSQMLDEKSFHEMAVQTLNTFGSRLKKAPSSMPQMMSALDFSLKKPKQIVIAGKPEASDTRAMLRAVREPFVPGKIILLADGGEGQTFLGKHLEFMQNVKPIDGKATSYVCENYVCQLPTTNIATTVKLLMPSKRFAP